MYILFLPRVGFYRPTRGKNNIHMASMNYFLNLHSKMFLEYTMGILQ
jgi:hypothetical protein